MDLNSSTISMRTSADESSIVPADSVEQFVKGLGSPNEIYKYLVTIA